MANNYSWNIEQMDTIPDFSGFTNFVTRIYWKRIGINETDISASLVGYIDFTDIGPDGFIEYSAITEIDVISWLDNYTNLVVIDSIIDQKINDIINPPIINLPFPWETTTTTTTTTTEEPPPTTTTTTELI